MIRRAAVGLLVAAAVVVVAWPWLFHANTVDDREEVIFWHFWGGADRDVVEEIVDRFNASQPTYRVRAVAMPGNNLDLKAFLAMTGGDPPDLINQDDPIVADWAHRGALTPFDELASPEEVQALREFLLPAARRLGTYGERTYAVCNGMDIRLLLYNKSLLDEANLAPPTTIEELDLIAERTSVPDDRGGYERLGFAPEPRRLWAWGVVFGGSFYDPRQQRLTLDDEPVVAAMDWMTSYRERFGADQIASFRKADQSLPGKTFPLLAGRYTAIMDGQWRVRDIAAAQAAQRKAGEPVTEYGVCPLPFPTGGRPRGGWVNGNFFIVPRGADSSAGAWEFIKFWIGMPSSAQSDPDRAAANAARTCSRGGWIPTSSAVSEHAEFQDYLSENPLMRPFVEVASSENQFPTPVIPAAPLVYRELNTTVAEAMIAARDGSDNETELRTLNRSLQQQLDQRRE